MKKKEATTREVAERKAKVQSVKSSIRKVTQVGRDGDMAVKECKGVSARV